MYISYVPLRNLADSENGSYFAWEGTENTNPSTNYAGGDKHTFSVTGIVTGLRHRARMSSVDGTQHYGFNSVDFGVLATVAAERWNEFSASSINGVNEISIWGTAADLAVIHEIEVIKGGDIECGFQPYTKRPSPEGKQFKSLSGSPHGTLFNFEKSHPITTVPLVVTDADIAQWWEFAESVAASETFWLDLKGTKAAPVSPVQAYMKQGTFSEIWAGPIHRQFSFTAIEL